MNRRHFLKTALGGASALALRPYASGAVSGAGPFTFDPSKGIIPAPRDPKSWPEFRRQLADWREKTRRDLLYSDALYRRPEFLWAARDFCCCFLMLCDETFYDRREGYTVRSFLETGRREFGGYDSLVLWHAYPRIGLDDRNQFDSYRDMPGGLPGLRGAVDELHRAGVRVFIDYNPWDTGTRREGKDDLTALCDMVRALDADGIFLDTMDRGAAEFRSRLDKVRLGVVLEGEGALPVERIQDHHLSWAQWFNDSEVPGVLRNKWFERRHLQHQIKRWNHDHSGEIQAAWMNGSGMMVWENVFGSWMGWSPRDRSLLRNMLPIQRRFAGLLCGENWTPLVPTLVSDVYASLWASKGLRLWTLVNRSDRPIEGQFLSVALGQGEKLFDLVNGKAASAAIGRIEPRGIGCFLAAQPEALGDDFPLFLAGRERLSRQASFDSVNPRLTTRLIEVRRTKRRRGVPVGMVEILSTNLRLEIEFRVRECGFYESVPTPNHRLGDSYGFKVERFEREVSFSPFAMDLTPVTNAQFAEFLRRSRYRPRHPENFLKHWQNGSPPADKVDHPVVYVDLDDARAYARWARKRLPTEEEWQYAAQGTQGLKYPWGNEMLPNRCNGGESGGTTPVKMFPEGRSPFGLFDMCGNVWEWTESERTDGRTRFSIIRGGSFYTAKGSGWYMDGGPRPCNFAEKVLLHWPGLDRCATVGFRCAVDLG